MDLKTFVATSLTQILDGIRAAQKMPGGNHVAAEGYINSQGNLMSGGTSGFFTLVDFDVLVLAGSKDGEPDVRVADVDISNKGERTNQNSSRVKFSVHVRLPKGGGVINPAGRNSLSYTSENEYED
ncbi:MAG: hypothetical protein Q8M26_04000 [Pseudolabrys sp.]|nr:hypothetical protein [Pseudolabrys sp.]